ncbi:MAG TPA: hypothetical protein EYP63_07930 [Desulfotomaculum sp.]|nr:hypothetical protein [Desulfotomaculum sp.]
MVVVVLLLVVVVVGVYLAVLTAGMRVFVAVRYRRVGVLVLMNQLAMPVRVRVRVPGVGVLVFVGLFTRLPMGHRSTSFLEVLPPSIGGYPV